MPRKTSNAPPHTFQQVRLNGRTVTYMITGDQAKLDEYNRLPASSRNTLSKMRSECLWLELKYTEVRNHGN